MQQVVLKPKDLSTVQPIRILCHENVILVEAKLADQDLKTTIKQCLPTNKLRESSVCYQPENQQ